LCKISLDKIAGVWYNGKFGLPGPWASRSILIQNSGFTQDAFCSLNFIFLAEALNTQIGSTALFMDVKMVLISYLHAQFFSKLGGDNQATT
jgi:hypothetical protein